MEEMKSSKKVLILLTAVVYAAHIGLNVIASKGNNALFPNSVANVSRAFPLEMTPAPATFAIWGLIFTLQIVWIVYSVITVCRSSPSANILSDKFYIAFILNVVSLTAWLFAWSRLEGVLSFIATLVAQGFINAAIGYSFADLQKFLDNNKGYKQGSGDVWAQRVIVQNALEFYATWTTIATLINLAIVLSYYLGTSTRIASVISLSILAVMVVLWFIVENSVLLKYTPCTFAIYCVLIIASLGIVSSIYAADKLVGGLALGLLILSIVCLVIRCIVIIYIHVVKPTYVTLVEE